MVAHSPSTVLVDSRERSPLTESTFEGSIQESTLLRSGEFVLDRYIFSCGSGGDCTTITTMPKLVSLKQQEGHDARATAYIKAYMLFPAGIFGLISMLGGVGGLGYQLVATDTYSWATFLESSGLLLLGGTLGWLQTTYHQWILAHRPEVFAARMRQPALTKSGKPKRETGKIQDSPSGSPWAPVAYMAGLALLLFGSTVAVVYGAVHPLASYFLPWAGFFWAKLFFWKSLMKA